jgi:2-iminobutanoate/2-iminopropanoate deaminase
MRTPIRAEKAAAPKGPYSQAIACRGQQIYVAGQGPVDPATGEFAGMGFDEQATRTFENVRAILEAAGASMADVVKVNVYLQDMGNFSKMNEIYTRFFPEPYPARTTVPSALVGFMIEVDAIAVVGE